MSRYIDADKVYQELIEEYPSDSDHILKVDYDDIRRIVMDFIDDAPTEDVKPIVRGEWIRDEFGGFRCSVCEDYNAVNYDRFCNNCGADMRNESEEEE